MSEILFNRKMYEAVKKMDRQEMENYLIGIYRSGFRAGTQAGNKADFKIKLVEILNNSPGVGIKTFDKIMATAKEMGI